MRPFRFFFALSVGLILFFFLARVLVFALVFAAIMSVAFFVVRKIRNFFMGMTWEDRRYAYEHRYHRPKGLPEWHYDEEPLFGRREKQTDWLTDYRTIEVR